MMPDGNSAALRQHEAEQDRLDLRHSTYGFRVVQDIVDDLFDGQKVARLTLHDFTDDITAEEIGSLLLAGNRDQQIDRLDALKDRTERRIRDWCDGDGADEVAEREQAAKKDARADAAESRTAARRWA